MKKQVIMALGYTLFMGALVLGVCVVSKGDLHRLGDKIDNMGQVLVSPPQKELRK